MLRDELTRWLNELLEVHRFKDYCPNGLQVEGHANIRRVLCGVTASQSLIDHAVSNEYDAILVHHGFFWRGEDARITGLRKRRLAALIKNEINLFAYHLPLDAHPVYGNNVRLASVAGWQPDGPTADNELVWTGRPVEAATASEIADRLGRVLGRPAMLVGDGGRQVKRIAWCTGAAQAYFEQAVAAGADVYVSGEISEQTVHLARESGVPYISAGHHATERYGVAALADMLNQGFDIQADFLDLDNPV